jgi:membrane protein required for colicin V production
MKNLPFNYVDVIIVVLLVVGIFRGRKRGMSEELLTFLQWLIIVIGGSFVYQPLGGLIKQMAPFSLLVCHVMAYVLFALVVKLLFSQIQRAVGEKILGSNAFGISEYYLGMLAGMIRFGCVMLMIMALVNAREITQQERIEMAQFQSKNFEGISFPTFGSLQQSILVESFGGSQVKQHLGFLLIKSTTWQSAPLRRSQNKALDDVLGK